MLPFVVDIQIYHSSYFTYKYERSPRTPNCEIQNIKQNFGKIQPDRVYHLNELHKRIKQDLSLSRCNTETMIPFDATKFKITKPTPGGPNQCDYGESALSEIGYQNASLDTQAEEMQWFTLQEHGFCYEWCTAKTTLYSCMLCKELVLSVKKKMKTTKVMFLFMIFRFIGRCSKINHFVSAFYSGKVSKLLQYNSGNKRILPIISYPTLINDRKNAKKTIHIHHILSYL